jgi:hypothetical protein
MRSTSRLLTLPLETMEGCTSPKVFGKAMFMPNLNLCRCSANVGQSLAAIWIKSVLINVRSLSGLPRKEEVRGCTGRVVGAVSIGI